MPPIQAKLCQVCHSLCQGPRNYLMTCTSCLKGFHHKCCNPPLRDEELTSLLRGANKPGKGINVWKCRSCRLGKNNAQTSTTRGTGSGTMTATNLSNARPGASPILPEGAINKQPEVISLLSDSEDNNLQPPAKRPPPRTTAASDTLVKRRAAKNRAAPDLQVLRGVLPPRPPLLVQDQGSGAVQGVTPPISAQDLAWWRTPGGQPPPPPSTTVEDDDPSSESDNVSETSALRSDVASRRLNNRRKASLPRQFPQTPRQRNGDRLRSRRRSNNRPLRHGSRTQSATMDVDRPQPVDTAPILAPPKPATYRPPDVRKILQESIALGRPVFDDTIRQMLEPPTLGDFMSGTVPSEPATPANRTNAAGSLPTPTSLSPPPLPLAKQDSISNILVYHHGKFAQIDIEPTISSNEISRRPRKPKSKSKVEAKKLPSSRYDWTPSQWTYAFTAKDWIGKEFGEDVVERFERLSIRPVGQDSEN